MCVRVRVRVRVCVCVCVAFIQHSIISFELSHRTVLMNLMLHLELKMTFICVS